MTIITDTMPAMKLTVRESPTGRGVFADAPIAAGEHIILYAGPFLRYHQTTPQTYALQVAPDLYLGASGSVDDDDNHCCDPNAGIRIRGSREAGDLEVDLYAIRDIAAGDEITFDYSTTLDEDDFEFDCLCGSAICRGRVRDGKHLPDETWRRYVALGIVPDYVIRSRDALARCP
jgi:hypothetical protein